MGTIIGIFIAALFAGFVTIGIRIALQKEGTRNLRVSDLLFGSIVGGLVGMVILAIASFTTISASHVGVVSKFGQVQEGVLTEGAHFVNPLSKVTQVSTGLQTLVAKNASTATTDLQQVSTDISMNFRVRANGAHALYRLDPTLDYEQGYVGPAMYEVFKAVGGHYRAEELVTKRAEVSAAIVEALRQKLAKYQIEVVDVNIVNFHFSKAFDESIESKVVATQKAEQAQRDLERTKYEGEQKVVTAKAEAEAIRIQSQAVQAQGGASYIELKRIEKWDGRLPLVSSGNSGMMFQIPPGVIQK